MEVIEQQCGENWALYHGDSAEVLKGIPSRSVGIVVTSIPFSNLYCYSPSERDLGNVRNDREFWKHFAFISAELRRVMMPGRQVCVHVQNLLTFTTRDGVTGRKDFRGDCIRHFQQAGFIYHSEVTIAKNPQAQAIRNHPKGVLFVQLERDAAWMWQAQADYLCVFRAPGDNPEPVRSDITKEEWIQWANPVWPYQSDPARACPDLIWRDIRETDVLPVNEARDNDDERHLCPLQLGVIRRCVRLWSNQGDVVMDPFNGIGSTGVGAIELGRRYVGVELKPGYYRVAAANLRTAERLAQTQTLFSDSESEPEAVTAAL
jgi:DNA modification methylase